MANKGGIIMEERLLQQAVQKVGELGFTALGLTPTDVGDPAKKNIEYLCLMVFEPPG